MQKSFNTGIYTRLSRDDNNGRLESMSIVNQRQILIKYVEDRGWNLVEEYSDDGYSGTNFDRPAFRRMIKDAKSGRINCIVTKDLSRLGRNYSMTGYYTDEFFPLNDIRFVAVNDGVDTMGDNNDFAAFHNVINEFYPREISKKVRQVKKANAEKGYFMGSHAPYGYKKSPDDKHVLVIDEETAPVVRRIFELMARGYNGRAVADILNREGIPSPMSYRFMNRQAVPRSGKKYFWGSGSIGNILRNEAYIGNLVQGQREVISFKSKKRRLTPMDSWIRADHTHEPIVSRELFESVQDRRAHYKYYMCPRDGKAPALFSGLVKCADCGAGMSRTQKGPGGAGWYRCNKYTNDGRKACTPHAIREDILEGIVLQDIRAYAKLLQSDKDKLVASVLSVLRKKERESGAFAQKQLDAANGRLYALQETVKSLYLDRQAKKVSETLFYSLLEGYEKEIREIESDIPLLSGQAAAESSRMDNIEQWSEEIRKYFDIEELDHDLLMSLVEEITVSEPRLIEGRKVQDVEIRYLFVGDLSGITGGRQILFPPAPRHVPRKRNKKALPGEPGNA